MRFLLELHLPHFSHQNVIKNNIHFFIYKVKNNHFISSFTKHIINLHKRFEGNFFQEIE